MSLHRCDHCDTPSLLCFLRFIVTQRFCCDRCSGGKRSHRTRW